MVFGLVLVALGLLWPLLGRLGFGHLPGDFSYRGDHILFHFPLATLIVISLVLTLIL
ncbi:MAG: DUF2905 domain-containing protein [Stellaceae bacterium]